MTHLHSLSSIVPGALNSIPPIVPGAHPLVVLSNRGPYVRRQVRDVPTWCRTVGGLVSALDPAVRARGGQWISAAEPGECEVPPLEVAGYGIGTIELDENEIEGYYRRVSNGVLWPLLHSFSTRVRTLDAPWSMYHSVNIKFAERAALDAPVGAAVWIHDFHLMLVPNELRKLRPDVLIGWFNHVPFPPPEIFATLPRRDDVVEGLLGADLLGFQTRRDARNFLDIVSERTGYAVDHRAGHIDVDGRRVTVRAFPIGIDTDSIQNIASDPDLKVKRERLRHEIGGQRVFLAVDRLDYTKGVPERLMAFAQLLERHPECVQRVTLVQVAVPSRTEVEQYAALKREVDEMVGNINGKFSRPGWTPVHYLYRSFDLSHLVALYSLADVAVVTPLRDGMNLVAQEFCASRMDRAGVLLLSEFAGAASVLDGAVLVNPFDIEGTADAMNDALSMSREEQEDRMRRMQSAVRKLRIGHWQAAFVNALEATADPPRGSQAPHAARYARG